MESAKASFVSSSSGFSRPCFNELTLSAADKTEGLWYNRLNEFYPLNNFLMMIPYSLNINRLEAGATVEAALRSAASSPRVG
jgi:hypothetical protein